jgi:hypothetical protein
MISLNIDYKKWKKYYENASLSEGIEGAYTVIGDIPYDILNIDVEKIRSKLLSEVKPYKNIKEALEKIKMKDYAIVGDYSALIENIVFEALFNHYYKPFISSEIKTSTPKISKKVVLMSNKDWIVVKKLSGEDDIEPREVASFLLNQKFSLLGKIYEKNSKYQIVLDDLNKKLKGKRKNVNSLILAYEVAGKDSYEFALASSVVGYSLTPDVVLLKKTFPEYKPPAIKGRKPKK